MNIKYTNKSVNRIYWGVLLVILLTLINNGFLESGVISLIIYAIQVLMIVLLAFKEKVLLFRFFTKPLIFFSTIILVTNLFLSNYEAEYSLLIKYFGYVVALFVGIDVAKSVDVKLSKNILIGIVFIPFLMVAILDKSPVKDTFFPNTNNFVFWGIVSSFLYYVTSSHKKKFRNSLIIILSYILVGSTIGIVMAFMLTIVLVNLKNLKSIILILVVLVLCFLLISFSDISIFVRIRAVIHTLSYVDINNLKDIENLNLYELNQYANAGDRNDNTSALWRIQQWLWLITAFLENWYYAILIGLGENFTTFKTGLPPHNDLLKIFCEYGMIVFIAFLKYIKKAICILFKTNYIYFVLTIVIFHFSENLIHTFPTNFTFYFCLGYVCTKSLKDTKK